MVPATARDESRFLCPYDLRRIPIELASRVLRSLGAHHTHAALSSSTEPAVRLLQLFVFPTVDDIPSSLQAAYAWARNSGLVEGPDATGGLALTPEGERVVGAWREVAVLDW
ncbi:MAG TPA: hypothetical protein VFF67_04585 [Thermoplasmata archaeon]|nr:hypothetical protein [Thermoplasmata archaeon]